MAETVYKKISDLPSATLPLAGTEYVELSATGASKKGLWSGLFGAGWWAKLSAALSAFKAPDADHADDADTVDGDTLADLHDAAQLTGNIHLDRIPAELTGKNAATATLATSADTVDTYHAGLGVGKLQPFRGSAHGVYTFAQIYAVLSWVVPNVNDAIPINGGACSPDGTPSPFVYVLSKIVRTSSAAITLYSIAYDGYHSNIKTISLSASSSSSLEFSFTY